MDDIISQNGELHIVVGKPVKLLINSRDVIHDVGLPHFRIKMDAVPGITTQLSFTPTITTEEMKKITHNPDFVYEIACDQLCGKGHYSMRGTVIVETQAEHDAWLAKQQTYYSLNAPSAAPAAPGAEPEKAKTDTTAAAKSVTMK
jgi:cytochrome c oxidase subunit 2